MLIAWVEGRRKKLRKKEKEKYQEKD